MDKRNELGRLKIKDVMHLVVENPTVVKKDETISKLLEAVNKDLKTRHVYVVDDENKLIGSVRMNSIVKYLFPMKAILSSSITSHSNLNVNIFSATAENLMKIEPFSVKAESTLSSAATIMIREEINELPVVDDEMHIIGQINVYEIIEAYKAIENKQK